jgi:hypothetical protein
VSQGRIFETLTYVAHHAFSLREIDGEWDGDWTNETWTDDRIGVAPGVVTVFSHRAAGNAPVIVERGLREPEDDLEDYDHVVEASFELSSGKFEVAGEKNEVSTRPLRMKLSPGTFRVRAYTGNQDSCTYDEENGAEHYRIVFWRAPAAEPVVLRRFEETPAGEAYDEKPSRAYTGTRKAGELRAWWRTGSVSRRCLAAVALLRLDDRDGVKAVLGSLEGERSPTVRRVVTSSLWLAGDRGRRLIETFAASEDHDLRLRALQSLSRFDDAAARELMERAGAELEDDREQLDGEDDAAYEARCAEWAREDSVRESARNLLEAMQDRAD